MTRLPALDRPGRTLCYLAVALAALPVARARAEDPTPDALINRAEAALGGRAVARKIVSYHAVTTLESPVGSMRSELFWARSGGALIKRTMEGMGEQIAATNGSVGWRSNPLTGAKLLGKAEIADLRRQAAPHIEFLDLRTTLEAKYASITSAGRKTIDERPCYVVRVVGKPEAEGATPEQGEILFDIESGLPAAMTVSAAQDGRMMTTTARLADWADLEGGKFFRKMIVSSADQPDLKMQIVFDSIELNGVDNAVFEPPAEVAQLLAAKAVPEAPIKPVTLEELTPEQRALAEQMITTFGQLETQMLPSMRRQLLAQRNRLPAEQQRAFDYVLQWIDERIGDG
ncbi:MAG: hypothetical protein ACYTF9_02325 [Planctomycetota bacterium]|jgi:hypothetical protein